MHRSAAVCLFAIAAAAGCRSRPTGPDANYQQAATLYQQLYATQLDDAYADPKMDDVVALLQKVDAKSSDADAAKAMLGSIQRGREALAKDRVEREKVARAAAVAAPAAPSIDPEKFLAANEPDAGPPPDPFGTGALISEINAQTGGCLTDNEPFNENGTGVHGTVYRVVPGPGCAGKLPGYAGQAVLVVNGRIYRRIADPNPPQQQAAPPVDAGAAARPPAPPADAGEPEYQIVIPGAPQPGATPPPAQQE